MESLAQLKRHISVTTLAESVYETLLESILSGQLASGTELSVVAVAKTLEVSRTPVHEALRQLARDGLVEQAVNRTSRVATFTAADVHDIFEMRQLLEGAAAERAATRLDEEELARLRWGADVLAASRGAVDWVGRWVRYDEDFHAAIARGSGSPRLANDIGRYRLLHRCFNRISANADVLQAALAEHQAILDRLEAADPDGARRAMAAHVVAWQAYFVARFPKP